MTSDPPETERLAKSLLTRARNNDVEAIETMFRQFIMAEEKIFFAEYLGTEGLWGIGVHSFAALTDRRLATMRVGAFGEVVYQDGLLEYINSTVVHQPSKFMLYVLWVIVWLGMIYFVLASATAGGVTLLIGSAIFALLAGFIFMLATAKMFFRVRKCGAVWWIREGVAVYAFSNRKRLVRVNALARMVIQLRDILLERTQLKPAP